MKKYLLEKEGRYCFLEGHRLLRQVIIYMKDKMALFRGLAQIQIHGHRHDKLSFQEIVEVAKRGHISLTCGSISSFIARAMITETVWTTEWTRLVS
jgi:hypothetical protein